jgi:hypothetical protein
MATIAYRPELENPARDGGLSFAMPKGENFDMSILRLEPGVNRKVDDSAWENLKDTPSVKALVKIGAIQELKSKGVVENSEESDVSPEKAELSDVLGLAVIDAVRVIESSFDESFLGKWKVAEGRSTIINKINARLRALKEGKG